MNSKDQSVRDALLDPENKLASVRAEAERQRADPERMKRLVEVAKLFAIHDEILVPATVMGLGSVVDFMRAAIPDSDLTKARSIKLVLDLGDQFRWSVFHDEEKKNPAACALRSVEKVIGVAVEKIE